MFSTHTPKKQLREPKCMKNNFIQINFSCRDKKTILISNFFGLAFTGRLDLQLNKKKKLFIIARGAKCVDRRI